MAISRHVILAVLIAGSPVIASAQSVLLQIRPRAGDTLAVRMDQKVEMTGVPTGCATGYSGTKRPAAPEPAAAGCSASKRQMTTVMQVFSRAIVERTTGSGAVVLAVTDSIRTSLSGGSGPAAPPKRVASNSGSVEIVVSTDGGGEVVDSNASPELRAIFGQMPATLSRNAVSVGESWVRQMRVPIATEDGATSFVKATFTLDSLGRNGDVAYISMKGTLSHDHSDGSDSELDGWISGTMQLDRRLAWVTHTRAVIDVESTVRPTTGGAPMRVRTKITQVLRAKPIR